MSEKRAGVRRRILAIRLVAFDVDGVLTDGKVYLDGNGQEHNAYYIHDGLGIRSLLEAGIEVAFVSARAGPSVAHRARALGVGHLYLNANDKWGVCKRLLDQLGLHPGQLAYMGDDMPDLPVLSRCGWACAPANARPEVKQCADWVASEAGGAGAVRAMCEVILREQGAWKPLLR